MLPTDEIIGVLDVLHADPTRYVTRSVCNTLNDISKSDPRPKANGSLRPKVFAVKDVAVEDGQTVSVRKRQPFKPITTRVLYPGRHEAELVVNGAVLASVTSYCSIRRPGSADPRLENH